MFLTSHNPLTVHGPPWHSLLMEGLKYLSHQHSKGTLQNVTPVTPRPCLSPFSPCLIALQISRYTYPFLTSVNVSSLLHSLSSNHPALCTTIPLPILFLRPLVAMSMSTFSLERNSKKQIKNNSKITYLRWFRACKL